MHVFVDCFIILVQDKEATPESILHAITIGMHLKHCQILTISPPFIHYLNATVKQTPMSMPIPAINIHQSVNLPINQLTGINLMVPIRTFFVKYSNRVIGIPDNTPLHIG